MRFLRSIAAPVAAVLLTAAVALMGNLGSLVAQTYPTNTPVYIPQALFQSQTLTTVTTSTPYNVNGVSVLNLRVLGTSTGLTAQVQGTEALRSGVVPTWTNLAVEPIGVGGVPGGRQVNIIANGLYRVAASGYSMIRVNISAISTGTAILSYSGGVGADLVRNAPALRNSYSASAVIATGATTHFWSISGSATTTVRVTRAACAGKATGAISLSIIGTLTSTADSVDAGTVATATRLDQSSPAATAVAVSHTTSPTSGTLIGQIRSDNLVLSNAATPVTADRLVWEFGTRPWISEVVLRGVAQAFSLDTNAAFGAGAAVGCHFEWDEE